MKRSFFRAGASGVHAIDRLRMRLATAHRKGLLLVNPMTRVEQIPNPEGHIYETDEEKPDSDDIREGLTEAELRSLVTGFESTSQYPIVQAEASEAGRREALQHHHRISSRIPRSWKRFGSKAVATSALATAHFV
jgi:hypothetical protein